MGGEEEIRGRLIRGSKANNAKVSVSDGPAAASHIDYLGGCNSAVWAQCSNSLLSLCKYL